MITGILGSTQGRQDRHLIVQQLEILIMQSGSTPQGMSQQLTAIQPRRPAHTMWRMSTIRQDRLPTGLLTLQNGITPLSMSRQLMTMRQMRPARIMPSMSATRQGVRHIGLLLAGRKLPEHLHLPQV